jgi:hypothetical protein
VRGPVLKRVAACLGSLALGAVLIRRRGARPALPAGAATGTNWSPVERAEPSLREARSMW